VSETAEVALTAALATPVESGVLPSAVGVIATKEGVLFEASMGTETLSLRRQ
jgi:hypothetical protein